MAFSLTRGQWIALAVVGATVAGVAWWQSPAQVVPAAQDSAPAIRPSLSVRLVSPQHEEWPMTLDADGNVMAWQEAVIGAELGQYRITEVTVQVGDRVRKNQVLARIADDAISSELTEAKAAVSELEASAGEARGNAERSRTLRDRGFYSAQMNTQFDTIERTADSRLAAARARLQSAELRMDKTSVTAPDDGVISARTATVGSLTQQGQELFRLIRGGRLEWQAEIPAAAMSRVKPGAVARLSGANGEPVKGVVRTIAPNVDPRTRNGIVFVDLAAHAGSELRAGMFARGNIETGRATVLTLPQSAIVQREGFSYVFGITATAATAATTAATDKADGQSRVEQIRIRIGQRNGERIEIKEGLKADARIVESGAGFLADGDIVKVVAP